MAERNSFERSSTEIPTSPTAAPGIGSNVSPETRNSFGEQHKPLSEEANAAYSSVLQSEIGVNTLLNRLKQSIASARDFAAFLKKRSALEEEHAQSLKKLCRTTSDAARRPDSRQGSYGRNYAEISRIHERMADNGIQFALSLHQMHEDLQELAADKERGRKEWKQKGLSWEKRVQDAEAAMDKAKSKYNSLAEDYDRARTGDRQTGRFGLKGPKSAAQVEEDLNRKMHAADGDYASKVQTAQSFQQELVSTQRPQAVKAIEHLIQECDSGLTLQMQKFATFNEKLLLSNGLCVSPLKGQDAIQGPQGRSLREVVSEIDNEKDLKSYVSSFASKAGPRQQDLRYEPHHTIQPIQHHQPPAQSQALPALQTQTANRHQPQASFTQLQSPSQTPNYPYQNGSSHSIPYQDGPVPPFAPAIQSPSSNFMEPPNQIPVQHSISNAPPTVHPSQQPIYNSSPYNESPTSQSPYNPSPRGQQPQWSGQQPTPPQHTPHGNPDPQPTKAIFGISLEDLFARDGSAVPMVVYQCLQAVDLFGLEEEGIYRLSGNATHIQKLRTMFDNEASQVDFRNPETFYHDVNSVAGLLKQFFRDLPDPLFTREHYDAFIDAARIDDDISRRDSLHAQINSLPDPNYATLRALTLHLHRVQEHSGQNRMNAGNLAICFGPTLMVGGGVPAIADAGWQVRAVDTILQNAYSIFDED